MSRQIYNGLFFNAEEINDIVFKLGIPVLENVVENPHITFAFNGSRYSDKNSHLLELTDVGKVYPVSITGYCCNGKNSGLMAEFPDVIADKYHNDAKTVHITTSFATKSSPVKTGEINPEEFTMLENPILIDGTLGFLSPDQGIMVK